MSRATLWLASAMTAAALSACASPSSPVAPPPPRMAPIAASSFGPELRALGLDLQALPRFESLAPWQVHALMSTFTRSLGVTCDQCHDPSSSRAPTRGKRLAKRMWNEFVRGNKLSKGPLYCDSCHHGQLHFLDRSRPGDVASYMLESYVGNLERSDGQEVVCATCHGEPNDLRFLQKW